VVAPFESSGLFELKTAITANLLVSTKPWSGAHAEFFN